MDKYLIKNKSMASLSTYWFFGLDGSVDESCNTTCPYGYIAKVTYVILVDISGSVVQHYAVRQKKFSIE